jgi:sec-independent protein translocase protein TatB
VFGISLTEVAMIALVALVVVGPQKLPGMLRTLGEWMRKIRQMTTAVRVQTGIDDILREEGIDGGIAELRNLVRGDLGSMARARKSRDRYDDDPYETAAELDRFREYPIEGVDCAGALPDDLVDEDEEEEEAGEEPEADEQDDGAREEEAGEDDEEEQEQPKKDAKPEAVERESTKAPWQVDRKK